MLSFLLQDPIRLVALAVLITASLLLSIGWVRRRFTDPMKSEFEEFLASPFGARFAALRERR